MEYRSQNLGNNWTREIFTGTGKELKEKIKELPDDKIDKNGSNDFLEDDKVYTFSYFNKPDRPETTVFKPIIESGNSAVSYVPPVN